MDALAQAFAATRAGRAVTVCVSGESGIGKSSLMQRFAGAIARDAEAIVLEGRCYERETVPYKGFDGVIDTLSRHLRALPAPALRPLLPDEVGLLPLLFPVLERVPAIAQAPRPRADGVDPHQLRARAFAAVRQLLAALARSRPVLVIIDDLHWSDHDSLLLLRSLLEGEAPPLLLLLSQRDVPGSDRTSGLPGDVRRVVLRALPPAEALGLAQALLERLGVADATLAERIAAESGGHPMFIDALVRQVATHGQVRLPATPRLDDAIRARAAQLPPVAATILELVAVAETQLPVDVVRAASGADAVGFDRALAQLAVASLVRRGRLSDVDLVEPYHDKVRVSIGGAIPAETRSAHHRRLAEALERLGLDLDRPEDMARHLAGAGEKARAGNYAHSAAQRAARGLAFDRAAEMYRLALELGPFAADERRELLIARAEALVNAGRAADSVDVFLAAVDGAGPAQRLLCLQRAATLALYTGAVARGFEIMSQLSGELGFDFPHTPAAALPALVGQRLRLGLGGLRWKARHASELSLTALGRFDALHQLAMSLSLCDNIRGALFQARAIRLALELGEPKRMAMALLLEASYHAAQSARGVARAGALRAQACAAVEGVVDPLIEVQLAQHTALHAYFAGDFRTTVELLEGCQQRLVREFVDNQMFELLNASRLFHCLALRELGALRQLGERVEQFTRMAQARGEVYLDTTLRRLCSIVWLARDRADEAEWHVRESAWPPVERGFHLQHAAISEATLDIALYRGDVRPVLRAVLADKVKARRAHWLRVRSYRIRAEWVGGRAHLAAARTPGLIAPREARRRCVDAIQGLRKEGMAHADVFAHLLAAGVAVLDGDQGRAVRGLEHAAQIADETGMNLAAAVARRRRGELLGGSEGSAAVVASDAALRAEGVVSPERIADVVAPGFTSAR